MSSPRYLTPKQRRELEDFVALHREGLEAGRYIHTEFCEQAGRELGFGRAVPLSSFRSACQVMGVAPRSGRKVGKARRMEEQLTSMQAALESLERRVDSLEERRFQ